MRPLTVIFSVAVIIAAGLLALTTNVQAGEGIQEAIAVIHPVAGESVSGELHITPTPNGLKISGSFENLEPGSHGFHVHRYGNCTAPNDGSVGPHFAPIVAGEKYHGDLPHVEADQGNRADYEASVKTLSFAGEYSVIGRGLVIHGLDGDKIGCGVIGIAR